MPPRSPLPTLGAGAFRTCTRERTADHPDFTERRASDTLANRSAGRVATLRRFASLARPRGCGASPSAEYQACESARRSIAASGAARMLTSSRCVIIARSSQRDLTIRSSRRCRVENGAIRVLERREQSARRKGLAVRRRAATLTQERFDADLRRNRQPHEPTLGFDSQRARVLDPVEQCEARRTRRAARSMAFAATLPSCGSHSPERRPPEIVPLAQGATRARCVRRAASAPPRSPDRARRRRESRVAITVIEPSRERSRNFDQARHLRKDARRISAAPGALAGGDADLAQRRSKAREAIEHERARASLARAARQRARRNARGANAFLRPPIAGRADDRRHASSRRSIQRCASRPRSPTSATTTASAAQPLDDRLDRGSSFPHRALRKSRCARRDRSSAKRRRRALRSRAAYRSACVRSGSGGGAPT